MALFKNLSNDKDIDSIIAEVYNGTREDDIRTAEIMRNVGVTSDTAYQVLAALHGKAQASSIKFTDEQIKKLIQQ